MLATKSQHSTCAQYPYSVSPGRAYPLGATNCAQGTNFAIFSANATKIELCLFDDKGEKEDDALMIIFNAHQCEIHYQLPQLDGYWQKLTDTSIEECHSPENITLHSLTIAAQSCAVLSYTQTESQKESMLRTSEHSKKVKSTIK